MADGNKTVISVNEKLDRLMEAVNNIKDTQGVIIEQQEIILDRQDDLAESISNLSLPGTNYGVEEYE